MTIRVIAPFADALDVTYDNADDTRHRAELEALSADPMTVTLVGEDETYPDNCISTGRLSGTIFTVLRKV